MRDASTLFLLKNSLGSKMKKGLRNFCTDDGSTSTLHQNGSRPSPLGLHHLTSSSSSSSVPVDIGGLDNSNKQYWQQEMERQPTLEEMILKLDLEEEIARKSKALELLKEASRSAGDQYNGRTRMSCVNNSDILRSARNALNQYPRFSLDGRDAMYRSSFRNSLHLQQNNNHISSSSAASTTTTTVVGNEKTTTIPIAARRSSSDACSSTSHGYYDASSTTTLMSRPLCRNRRRRHLPATLAGESVVWCKPGIVAKLMGLDAMPVPSQQNMMTSMRRRGDRRRESGKRSSVNAMDLHNCSRFDDNNYRTGSCSATSKTTTAAGNYCVMKPVVVIHRSFAS